MESISWLGEGRLPTREWAAVALEAGVISGVWSEVAFVPGI